MPDYDIVEGGGGSIYTFSGDRYREPAILNSAKDRIYVPCIKSYLTLDDADIGIMARDNDSTTSTFYACGLTLSDTHPIATNDVLSLQDGDTIYVVVHYGETATPEAETPMHIFYGEFDIPTQTWDVAESVASPLTPRNEPDDVVEERFRESVLLTKMASGLICFISNGDPYISMGISYARAAVYYRSSGTWYYISDDTHEDPTRTSGSNLASSFYNPDDDHIYCASYAYVGQYLWKFTDDPSISLTLSTTVQIFSKTYRGKPMYVYPGTSALCHVGVSGATISYERVSDATIVTNDLSTSDSLIEDIDAGRFIAGDGYLQWVVGTFTYDSTDYYSSLIELDSDGDVINVYQNTSTDDTFWESNIFGLDADSGLWQVTRGTNASSTTNQTLGFRWTDFAGSSALEVDGALVRGASALSGSVSIIDDSTVTCDGVLIRGSSELAGSIDFNLTPVVRGDLTRGGSVSDGAVLIGTFVKYITAFLSNITKTSQILESLHFIMSIDGIEFKMHGFTIRSSLVDSETKISDIAEIRTYLSDEDISSFIPDIGTVNVIIKSVYSFGSSVGESTLFSGILDDISKRDFESYSFVKASHTENKGGSSYHTPEKIVTYSAKSARIKFDHTIKPNDFVIIDGVQRKALNLTHYNYEGKGSHTEVRSG